MRPGVATGIGSVTEEETLDDISSDDDSLKDISTARRKRKLTFQNETTSGNDDGSAYSTVIVRKRKKKNKNGTDSTESSGRIQLCWQFYRRGFDWWQTLSFFLWKNYCIYFRCLAQPYDRTKNGVESKIFNNEISTKVFHCLMCLLWDWHKLIALSKKNLWFVGCKKDKQALEILKNCLH